MENISLDELRKLSNRLNDVDLDLLQTWSDNKKEPVFDLCLYKQYYRLIAEYPHLTHEELLRVGYYIGKLSLNDILEIERSPFHNLVHKYCRAYHWYKVYNNLYKEGDKYTCPFTDKECTNEDVCLTDLFVKMESYRHVIWGCKLNTNYFLDMCRSMKIFPSIPYIEKEIERIATELVSILPINEKILYKDSIRYFKSLCPLEENELDEKTRSILESSKANLPPSRCLE